MEINEMRNTRRHQRHIQFKLNLKTSPGSQTHAYTLNTGGLSFDIAFI